MMGINQEVLCPEDLAMVENLEGYVLSLTLKTSSIKATI